MHVIYPCCAGLDVHKKTVVACRMKAEGSKPSRREVKTFSTMTRQLLALSDWLSQWGCTRVINRVQKALEGANIKLSSVASDTLGVSGRAILKGLIQGQEDPAALAELAKGRLRNKKADLEQALTGFFRPHHRFLLSHLLAHLDFLETQLSQLSDQIAQHIEAMGVPPKDPQPPSGGSPKPAQSPTAASSKPAQASGLLPNQAMALWDTIPGVNQTVAEVMVAEMGVDMGRFPTHRHLASWVGLAPGNHESAGKRQSGRTTKGNPALRLALVQAAWAASRTKDTYLSALYRRLAARRGKKRALVAVAHSILTAAYHMACHTQPYQDPGSNYFDQRKKHDVVSRLSHRLEKLGYNVALTLQAA